MGKDLVDIGIGWMRIAGHTSHPSGATLQPMVKQYVVTQRVAAVPELPARRSIREESTGKKQGKTLFSKMCEKNWERGTVHLVILRNHRCRS